MLVLDGVLVLAPSTLCSKNEFPSPSVLQNNCKLGQLRNLSYSAIPKGINWLMSNKLRDNGMRQKQTTCPNSEHVNSCAILRHHYSNVVAIIYSNIVMGENCSQIIFQTQLVHM